MHQDRILVEKDSIDNTQTSDRYFIHYGLDDSSSSSSKHETSVRLSNGPRGTQAAEGIL